jgi:hypothetical protein
VPTFEFKLVLIVNVLELESKAMKLGRDPPPLSNAVYV